MEETFGVVKKEATDCLDSVSNELNLLLKGSGSTPGLIGLRKKLESFVDESSIGETEQKFIDTISVIIDSIKGVNGIVTAVSGMANAGCPITYKINEAEYGTADYIEKLSSVKLWNKFRDRAETAVLVDINDQVYTSGSNGVFYIEVVNSIELQEPAYREGFNVPPYKRDNKTIYLYFGNGVYAVDSDNNNVPNSYFKIKNLRTIVNGVEHPGCVYIYKNESNNMCAKLLFDFCYPTLSAGATDYPEDYFSFNCLLDYNVDTGMHSIRVY